MADFPEHTVYDISEMKYSINSALECINKCKSDFKGLYIYIYILPF